MLALVPYPSNTVPSQRFRFEQWAEDLEHAGIRLHSVAFADEHLMQALHQHGRASTKVRHMLAACVRRIGAVLSARRYDVVVVHRAVCLVGPAAFEHWLARWGPPLLFDFDDAIYLLHTSTANLRTGWLKFPGKTATLCRLSACVTVGNDHLADYARRYNERVTVIPSSIDTDRFRPRPARGPSRSRVVIGWTGSSTSQTHLEMFAPVLRDLSHRRDVEIRVHSDREPNMPGVPVVWRRWLPETENEELSAFDVGIMPMPDDQWSRGKCAMKALLYMSVGVPALCSAVGTNREVIRHGENGLLAATPEDWQQSLDALIDDPGLRVRLGAAGRTTVEQRYSRRRCAGLFAETIRSVVEGR